MAAIATAAGVAIIAGCTVESVSAGILSLADNHVKLLLNRDFDSIKSHVYYVDVENRNEFVDEYDRSRDFALLLRPVTEVVSVISNPDADAPDTLVEDTDYFVNLDDGSIKFSDDFDLLIQERSLKITYSYGYSSAPAEVVDYANYFASYIKDTIPALAKNSDGAILKEVEIGRYREAYADGGAMLKSKYTAFLQELKSLIIQKYKIWD
jgi:hypothetical protein